MNHVVLVEDDPSMRDLLKIFLRLENFETTAVEQFDIASIINQIQQTQPEFLLMDVHLNGVDGLGLLSAIRARPTFDPIKIMMTSGEDCEDTCHELGANGFLLKPYNPMDLVNWLRSNN